MAELNPGALFADDLDEAYIGWVENRSAKNLAPIAVYSTLKCIQIFMRIGMDYESAVAYFESNVAGAYVGPNTPLFLADRVTGGGDEIPQTAT